MKSTFKILLIRFSAIGDIILTSAFVRVLKKQLPEAEIHFLTKEVFQDLYLHHPSISFLKTVKKDQAFKELIKELKAENYDHIIDLHKNIRSVRIALALQVSYSTYSKERFKRWQLIQFKKNISLTPVLQRYFDAGKKWNLQYDGLGTTVYVPNSYTSIPNKRFIAVCPGASWQTKQWVYWKELCGKLLKENHQLVLIGGKEDDELCSSIVSELHSDQVISLAGKTTLLESAKVLKEASLLISNDSGMMHLAESQKTPVISIFGSTTPNLGFAPHLDVSTIIQKELDCRPCTPIGRTECPKGHFKCMKEISAHEVVEAVRSTLT